MSNIGPMDYKKLGLNLAKEGLSMSITIERDTNEFLKCQGGSVEDKLKNYLKEIDKILDYDIYIVFQFNSNRNVAVTKSYYLKDVEKFNEKIPHSIFFEKNSNYLFNDLIENKEIIEYFHEDNSRCLFAGIKKAIYVPLFSSKDKTMELIGCLYFGTYRNIDFDLDTLSKKVQSYEYISNMSFLLDHSIVEGKNARAMLNIIHVLMMVLEKKDNTLFSHSYNVANWCKRLGNEVNLDGNEIIKLYIAGLLHDVGKALIDDSIINKNGKLTMEEYEVVKQHSLYSYNMTRKILDEYSELSGIAEVIKYHHERYDGQGYPEGLKEKEIPFYSCIISICDAVDAMLSERPYKKRYSVQKVIRELQINRGKQFHPKLVDVMIDMLSKVQNGYKSLLDSHLSLCHLMVNYEEDVYIFEGILTKNGNYYIFSPNDEIKAAKIELGKIISCEMAVKDSTTVFDYKIKIADIKDNKFYISSIELEESPDGFNLFWNLEGILYLPIANHEMSVNILQIGGDQLRFSSDESDIFGSLKNKMLRLDILFSDYTVDITGTISKTYKLGHRYYCDFQYRNIPDFKRDKIFRQLFKKQIELRKMCSANKNPLN